MTTKKSELLDALFEHASEGIVVSDSRGEIVLINPEVEKQFGYTVKELTGKQIELLIPAKFKQDEDLWVKHKDGSEFLARINQSAFKMHEDLFTIFLVFDITQKKKQEEALQREKGVAQLYLEVAPVIFIAVNKDGVVTLINGAGCKILGYRENEIIGKNWQDIIPPDAREKSKKVLEEVYSQGTTSLLEYENHILTSSGEKRTILWKITALKGEKENVIAILRSGEDITERKIQEELLKKTHEELNELNADLEKRVEKRTSEIALANKKLEESKEEIKRAYEKERELNDLKTRFVSMASHEFRNPLSTILSSITLIEEYNSGEQSEKRHKHIERIKNNVKNLTEILNDLLSLGKLEEGKVLAVSSVFNVKELAEEIAEEIETVSKDKRKIKYTHTGKTQEVYMDKILFRNILANLLNNAIKYSSDDVIFSTFIEKTSIKVTVEDKGIGIPEEDQQHIFDRFFRAQNVTNIEGTGLGLSIVKKYIDLMRGNITFTSGLCKGTVFTVTFPLHT